MLLLDYSLSEFANFLGSLLVGQTKCCNDWKVVFMVFTMAGQCVQNNEGIEETNRRNATNPFTKSLRSLTFTKHCFNVSTCNLDLPQKREKIE